VDYVLPDRLNYQNSLEMVLTFTYTNNLPMYMFCVIIVYPLV